MYTAVHILATELNMYRVGKYGAHTYIDNNIAGHNFARHNNGDRQHKGGINYGRESPRLLQRGH